MSSLPLERYPLFRTGDLDDAREQVAKVFCDHQLDFYGSCTTLDARMHSYRVGDVCANYLAYGGDMSIDPGQLESFYVVQVPLGGRSMVYCQGQQIFSHPSVATVISPTEHLRQMWSADCRQLILRIEGPALHARLRDMIGRPLWEPLVFEPEFTINTGRGALWMREFRKMVDDLSQERPSVHNPHVSQAYENSLITGLLVSQRHNYSDLLEEAVPSTVPCRSVNIVRELIEAHPEQRHTVRSLARAANVSERTLHAAFAEHMGTSPKAYLKEIRLQRAWEELRATHIGVASVERIARSVGFAHMGRFSVAYRQRFGERPSDTLRR